MAVTIAYRFPDEESALKFVRICVRSRRELAFLRDGCIVRMVDPSGIYSREVFRIARECGGNAD